MQSKQSKPFRTEATLVLAAACVFMGCDRSSPKAVQSSVARGDAIVRALEEYRDKHQSYPAQLDDLVPDFIVRIDPPIIGNGRWIYQNIDAGREFSIESDCDLLETSISRSSSWDQWLIDTK